MLQTQVKKKKPYFLIIILTTLDHLYLKTRLEKVRLKFRAEDSHLNSKEFMALLGGKEVSFLSF